jgi:DNA-binding response OmpR family regulator
MAKRILLVEDDPTLRKLLQKSLVVSGYEVDVAEHGLDGLMKIESLGMRPDLLIVDIMMPELDGMTFVRALKTHSETRRIPVIFVTAKTDPKSIVEGISLGAKFYLTKPFTMDDLLGKVKKALHLEE